MAPRIVEQLVQRIAAAEGLDVYARPLSKKVAEVVPHGIVKDTLSGTWLGHPLHPLLTDLPIGSWTSALALDLIGGERGRDAAEALVGLGVLCALPTAAAGLADWSDTLGEERRLGFVHAAGNVVALSCYAASWWARRRRSYGAGVAFGLLGATAATAGAYLGGHLAWRQGVNVDRHAWDHPSDQWADVIAFDELEDGRPAAVSAGDETVLLVRQGGTVLALSDVCAHMGGPLHEGELIDGCVQCPWHASVFRLDDGSVVHGPATGPQPTYETRVAGGRVSVRRR